MRHESDVHQWRYNSTNAPTISGVLTAIQPGSTNIEINWTNCLVNDNNRFDQNYAGTTSLFPNIALNGNDCNERDGTNVVGWRYSSPMPPSAHVGRAKR